MSPDAILEARAAGRLDHLLGVAPEETAAVARARSGATLTPSDVRTLYAAGHHEHIEAARLAGRINYTEG